MYKCLVMVMLCQQKIKFYYVTTTCYATTDRVEWTPYQMSSDTLCYLFSFEYSNLFIIKYKWKKKIDMYQIYMTFGICKYDNIFTTFIPVAEAERSQGEGYHNCIKILLFISLNYMDQ